MKFTPKVSGVLKIMGIEHKNRARIAICQRFDRFLSKPASDSQVPQAHKTMQLWFKPFPTA